MRLLASVVFHVDTVELPTARDPGCKVGFNSGTL
jgi:hypothetical protein